MGFFIQFHVKIISSIDPSLYSRDLFSKSKTITKQIKFNKSSSSRKKVLFEVKKTSFRLDCRASAKEKWRGNIPGAVVIQIRVEWSKIIIRKKIRNYVLNRPWLLCILEPWNYFSEEPNKMDRITTTKLNPIVSPVSDLYLQWTPWRTVRRVKEILAQIASITVIFATLPFVEIVPLTKRKWCKKFASDVEINLLFIYFNKSNIRLQFYTKPVVVHKLPNYHNKYIYLK